MKHYVIHINGDCPETGREWFSEGMSSDQCQRIVQLLGYLKIRHDVRVVEQEEPKSLKLGDFKAVSVAKIIELYLDKPKVLTADGEPFCVVMGLGDWFAIQPPKKTYKPPEMMRHHGKLFREVSPIK